jgi:predicted secreted hydrolase
MKAKTIWPTASTLSIAVLALILDRLLLPAAQAELLDRDGWQIAEPNYPFHFPEDHAAHFNYRTEWWYFTGNLRTAEGREFGYQLTFFRFGYLPPAKRSVWHSAFVMADVQFAHFTVTDIGAKQFHATASVSRGSFGEAGFSADPRLAWINDWRLDYNGNFHLVASQNDNSIDLVLRPGRPPVLQGDKGYSQKAAEPGHASEYYSITRLETQGTLRVGGHEYTVTGDSWFDREWATNQLSPEQSGWDWFSLQLSDGTDLMLYQMRDRSGQIDPTSNGTAVRSDGSQLHLNYADFHLEPIRYWTSPVSKARYPIGWKLRVDPLRLNLEVATPVENQELNLGVRYWEGCVRATGRLGDQGVQGKGYLELTGYEGSAPELTNR